MLYICDRSTPDLNKEDELNSILEIIIHIWSICVQSCFHSLQVNQLPSTTQLTLTGNRLACDCNTLWLKQWLISRRHQVANFDQVRCVSGQPQVLARVGFRGS